MKYLKAFCEEVKVGDVFVLKEPVYPGKNKWRVIAAGRVISPYRYEPIFYSVDKGNWDVKHCRRVLWKEPKNEIITSGGMPVRFKK